MVMWRALLFAGHYDHKDAEEGEVRSGAMESDHAVEAIPATVEPL
jgi:hypothetical protein